MAIEDIISAIDGFFHWVCTDTYFVSPSILWFLLVFAIVFIGLPLLLCIPFWLLFRNIPDSGVDRSDIDPYTIEQSMERMASEHTQEFAVLYAASMDPNTNHDQ